VKRTPKCSVKMKARDPGRIGQCCEVEGFAEFRVDQPPRAGQLRLRLFKFNNERAWTLDVGRPNAPRSPGRRADWLLLEYCSFIHILATVNPETVNAGALNDSVRLLSQLPQGVCLSIAKNT